MVPTRVLAGGGVHPPRALTEDGEAAARALAGKVLLPQALASGGSSRAFFLSFIFFLFLFDFWMQQFFFSPNFFLKKFFWQEKFSTLQNFFLLIFF